MTLKALFKRHKRMPKIASSCQMKDARLITFTFFSEKLSLSLTTKLHGLIKTFILTLFIFGGITKVFAQKQISGVVKDDKGPLVEATIKVKGTGIGTLSDKDGAFKISVPVGKTILVISYVGYQTVEINTTDANFSSTIILKQETSLKDVVIVGYGSQKKTDVTGAVGSVNSNTIKELPSPDALGALQGRVAGLNITQNSGKPGDYRVNIRGFNSINASNTPLFVIDGVIGADYNTINPNDIEKVDVLKDASASAIYGARGSGGVIIITTKQGSYNAPTTLKYNFVGGVNSLLRKIPLLNSAQYQNMEKQAYANSKVPYPDFGKSEPDLFNPDNTPKYNTDWQKEVYKPTFSHNHNLSVGGGGQSLKYTMSLSYIDARPLELYSFDKKYSARINLDSKINNWLYAGMNLSAVYNPTRYSAGGYGVGRMTLESLPYIPVKMPNGDWGASYMHELGEKTPANPVADATNSYALNNSTLAFANTYLEAILTPALSFKTSLSGQANIKKTNYTFSSDNIQRGLYNGISASVNTDNTIYWQSSSYFSYKKKIDNTHNIEAILGAEWSKEANEMASSGNASGFDGSYYLYNNLGAGSIFTPPSSSAYIRTTNSYFGRLIYSLKDKYLFTGTGRYDGASVFGANHKFAFFPSAAVAWRVSQEDFLKNSKVIDNLKLRLSYGSTGNSSIDPYKSINTLSTNYAIFSDKRTPGVMQGTIPNPDLRWEQTNQLDLGLDLDFFNNRINIVADVYDKVTKNLLLYAPVALSSGYDNVLKNIGSVRNRGFELGITSHNLTGSLTWSTTLNLTFNKNKILALGDNNEDIFPGPAILDQTNILRVGESVGTFWGYVQNGTWSSSEAAAAAVYLKKPGDIKIADLNNDGVINAQDQTIIGRAYPKYTGELINRLGYKNFDFSLDIGFSQGNHVMNIGTLIQEQRQTYANAFTTVLNAWTPQNQNTDVGYVRLNTDPHGSTLLQTSRYISDGSFIRGRNITLGYNFSNEIANKLGMGAFRIYTGLQNFFLLTKYKVGYDPESTSYPQPFAYGIDLYAMPRPMVVNIGLDITLK